MKYPSFVSTATRINQDLVVFDNTYRGFSFPRHFHETYLVEWVEAGTEHFYCNGSHHRNVQQDQLVLINPGEIHTGGDNSNHSEFKCRVFYPEPDAWDRIVGDSFTRAGNTASLLFSQPVIEDRKLLTTIKALFACHHSTDNELLIQELYQQVMIDLMQRHMKTSISMEENSSRYAEVLKRSIEYINDHIGDKLLLDDIARSAFLSPFHFLRIFNKLMGMTLHQYVLALRIERAKSYLLKNKTSIETTYKLVGFTDQSHFTKVFRKMTGLTPRQFKQTAGAE